MKNKGKTNVIIDIVLFLFMLAIFCIKGQFHEFFAYTMGILLILHLVFHWKQFQVLWKKGNYNAMLDLGMFAVMLAIFCVKGEIHEILAYTIGILAIIHIALHWKQFKAMYRHLLPEAGNRYVVTALTAILTVAILTAPLYITTGDMGRHEGPPPGHYDSGEWD